MVDERCSVAAAINLSVKSRYPFPLSSIVTTSGTRQMSPGKLIWSVIEATLICADDFGEKHMDRRKIDIRDGTNSTFNLSSTD